MTNAFSITRLIILIIIITFLSCNNDSNDITSSNELSALYKKAMVNYDSYKDSTAYYYLQGQELLHIDTAFAWQLKHLEGNYYSTKRKFKRALNCYDQASTSQYITDSIKATLYLNCNSCAGQIKDEQLFKYYYQKSDSLIEKVQSPYLKSRLINNSATWESHNGNHNKALQILLKADSLDHAQIVNVNRSNIQYKLGSIYAKKGNYAEAFNRYKLSLQLARTDNKTYLIPSIYNKICQQYRNNKQFDEAIYWQNKYLDFSKKYNNKTEIRKAYQGFGIIYTEMGQFNTAENYFIKSLEIAKEIGDPAHIAVAETNMGYFFKRQKKMIQAKKHFNSALHIRINNNLKGNGLIKNIGALADIEIAIKNYSQAELLLNEILVYTDSLPNLPLSMYAHKRLSKLYQLTNNAELWQKHFSVMYEQEKLLQEESSQKNLNAQLVKFQTKEKELRIEQQRIQIKQSRLTITILLFAALLLLTIIGSIVINYRRKIKHVKILHKQLEIIRKQNFQLDNLKKQIGNIHQHNTNESLEDKLIKMLEQDKIYLDSDVSLEKLANQLNTNITYLSQAINKKFSCNFKTIISYYRIEYAKQLMNNNSQLLIKQIAIESGFKSQSSFYSSFKGNTGVTPIEYRKK